MSTPVGAHVEIIEPVATLADIENLPCIKPRKVLVNGTDVGLLKRDGVSVDVGDDKEPTTVTLVLYPKKVEFGLQLPAPETPVNVVEVPRSPSPDEVRGLLTGYTLWLIDRGFLHSVVAADLPVEEFLEER